MRIPDTGIIELRGMHFTAFHGCLEEEKEYGNEFTVDFRCRYGIKQAAIADDLSKTLDYSKIYDIVAEQMSQPSNLLENVAARIFDAILEAHPEIEEMELKVTKFNPPVDGNAQSASAPAQSKNNKTKNCFRKSKKTLAFSRFLCYNSKTRVMTRVVDAQFCRRRCV